MGRTVVRPEGVSYRGEAEIDDDSVDHRPAERGCYGRQARDFQAQQESEAKKVANHNFFWKKIGQPKAGPEGVSPRDGANTIFSGTGVAQGCAGYRADGCTHSGADWTKFTYGATAVPEHVLAGACLTRLMAQQ